MILLSFFQIGNTIIEGGPQGAPLSWLDYISKLAPALLGIGTIIISIISLRASRTSVRTSQASLNLSQSLAENYDIKKLFVKNQFEVVCELMKVLNNTTLSFTNYYDDNTEETRKLGGWYDRGGGIGGWGINFGELDSSIFEKHKRDMKKEPSFTEDFNEIFNLTKYENDVFVPIEISKAISKLYGTWSFPFPTKPKRAKPIEEYIFISIPGHQGFPWSTKNYPEFIHRPLGPTYHTLENYLTAVLNLKSEISKWLNKYNIKESNISYDKKK